MDSKGELVAAAVVDRRVWDHQGDTAPDGVYLVGQPGPALPFVMFRAWKVPIGFVSEEIRLIGPSGRTLYRWGPQVRRMAGMMDLTRELDVVEDAVLGETGMYVASFIVDGAILGELEFPIYVQAAPAKLSKEIEDGLKKSDVIWIGTDHPGRRRTVPAWFAYKNGRILVVSQREPGSQEQSVPGVPDAKELVVITRRKGRDTSLEEFRAAQRKLEGPEWEEAAKVLVDKRKSRAGAPGESISRWRGSCDIVELVPSVPA
jgi:TusA-related sulfurtransferase